MKSIARLIFLLLFLTSCGEKPEEKAIISYVSTQGDTQYDLGIKIVELTESGTITVLDSIEYIDNLLEAKAKQMEPEYRLQKNLTLMEIESKESELKYESSTEQKFTRASIQARKNSLALIDSILMDIASKKYENLNSETMTLTNLKKKYLDSGTHILGIKMKCIYEYENPVTMIEQKTTRTFVLNPEKTKVIASWEITKK